VQKDRAAGEATLRESADLFERLAREGGVRNGKLFYNLGNAHLLRGDLGAAILAYRRAELYIPGDANLVQNLAYARQRVATKIESSGAVRARQALLSWHEQVPVRWRAWVFALSWAGLWACGLAWLLASSNAVLRRSAGVLAACLGVAALGCGASLAGRLAGDRGMALEAVLLSTETGYKGPDAEVYGPSFQEPLGAGVELRVVERRPGWVLGELADGRTAWLPEGAVGMVREGGGAAVPGAVAPVAGGLGGAPVSGS